MLAATSSAQFGADFTGAPAYLKASNPGGGIGFKGFTLGDFFGWSVAASGDTLVIGAPGEESAATGVNGDQGDNGAFTSGAVYVFVRNGKTWSQQAYLKASNTEPNDRFGGSVTASGDTVVVGADLEDSAATGTSGDQGDNSVSGAGAAYGFDLFVWTDLGGGRRASTAGRRWSCPAPSRPAPTWTST